MKKISVIVPVYNVEDYLERMLISLIEQSYKNLEIILIDDGSTDGSGQICDKYANIDERIKVVHKKNEGVAVVRNLGIKLATGKYIGFVDSDDVIHKDMFMILVQNLENNKADISVCGYSSFINVPEFDISNENKLLNKEDALRDIISDGVVGNFLWNKLFKKELFDDIYFPDGKIYEDVYVMPRLLEKCNLICVDSSRLYGYYMRNNSYVNTYSIKKNDNYLEVCDSVYNYLLKYDYLCDELLLYRNFYIYSAYLQAAKSRCREIFNSDVMNSYYKVYRKNYKFNFRNSSVKRILLSLLLFVNRKWFYFVVDKIC